MFYIHQSSCISPQQTFPFVDLEVQNGSVDFKLMVKEPAYDGIPAGSLRRMSKAVRIGVGAAMPLIKTAPDGFIIGTAYGGIEDCVKFLNQIVKYEEGSLTPGNFVQSTPNALAGTLGLITKNKCYNITHVHRGLAFENALIDAAMRLKEYPAHNYLLGAVDEVSAYNYNLEKLGGWYKQENFAGPSLYESNSDGSLSGEGTAMFAVNAQKENAIAELKAIHTLHSADVETVKQELKNFLKKNSSEDKMDLFITGENGDKRLLNYYESCESVFSDDVSVARFKHMTGEYPSNSATALWLACHLLQTQKVPQHMIKKPGKRSEINEILIYNNYKGAQHSFMIVSAVRA